MQAIKGISKLECVNSINSVCQWMAQRAQSEINPRDRLKRVFSYHGAPAACKAHCLCFLEQPCERREALLETTKKKKKRGIKVRPQLSCAGSCGVQVVETSQMACFQSRWPKRCTEECCCAAGVEHAQWEAGRTGKATLQLKVEDWLDVDFIPKAKGKVSRERNPDPVLWSHDASTLHWSKP